MQLFRGGVGIRWMARMTGVDVAGTDQHSIMASTGKDPSDVKVRFGIGL